MAHREGDPFFFPKTANFITKIVTHGCARPFYIYLETALPAAVEFAYTIFLLDLNDLIRMRGETIVRDKPKGLRRGKRHIPKVKFTAAQTPAQKVLRQGLKVLLIVTKPIELLGFVWLLYSAIDQFFFRWQSLLEKSTFCEQPIESGPLTRDRDGGRVSILPGGAAFALPNLLQNRGGWSTNSFSAGLPQGQFTAGCALSVTGPNGGITGVKLRLFITHFFGTTLIDGDEQDIDEGVIADFVTFGDFFLFGAIGGAIAWELVGPAVPVGLEAHTGYVFIQRTG